ncbi:hypothetical protein CPB85DRAFT_1249155 [Mucidula mucida]|nr:hypothetical protein CPB85DRAFT_1249155 [Mucidula mucida]
MPVLAADSGPFFYPWHDYVSNLNYRDVNHRLHHEIQAFAAYCQSSSEENTFYENVFHTVERVVSQNIPGARLRKSGSIVTGLALPMPDMDLVIVANSNSKAKIKKQLFSLRAGLTRHGVADWNDVEVRWHAPVPIICLKTRPAYGSISVDIGVNNTDGFAVADFMNDYKLKMPAFRPLALLLKNILSNENLNDSGNHGIGSYAALCMCIHFLETNPSGRDPAMINQPMKSESLGMLLSDLLYYYGVTFDYANSYISPSEGKALPKEGVTWINSAWAFTVQCLFNHG